MVDALADVVPPVALLGLLAVAYLHPRERWETAAAVVAGAAVLATRTLPWSAVRSETRHLVPVVAFLMAILVVAECCRSAGLFAAIGSRLARSGTPVAVFALTFVVATLTTVALSLDATVVLVTPVVLAAATATAVSARPLQVVCVRLANTASLLLPVSNLTNLLALPHLPVTFGRFALLMAPSWLFVLAVEYAVHRFLFRADLTPATRPEQVPALPLPRVPLLVVGLMLIGFAVASPLAVDPAWVAAAAAVLLAIRGLRRGELRAAALARSTHASFALFVLALGLVVAVLGAGPFGDLVAHLVPSRSGTAPGPGTLLAVALLGAVLANLVNNLPATLLLVPLVAPLGTTAVLATLIGINLGSSMTWSGSLANLLWRRTVQRSGGTVNSRDFHLVGLLSTPVGIAGGVLILQFWSGLV